MSIGSAPAAGQTISPPFASVVPSEKLEAELKSQDAHPLPTYIWKTNVRYETPLLGKVTILPTIPEEREGPSIEACNEMREAAYKKLGEIDKEMIIDEHMKTCFYYVIHRRNGNVAIASYGLSDPPHYSSRPDTTGLGFELIAEADEKEVGSGGAALISSWLFQMMVESVKYVKTHGIKFRSLLDYHGLLSMGLDLNKIEVPLTYTIQHKLNISLLLGIKADQKPECPLPEFIDMPRDRKIRLVTVRLLTKEENYSIRIIKDPQLRNAQRNILAKQFQKDGTYHVSTAVERK